MKRFLTVLTIAAMMASGPAFAASWTTSEGTMTLPDTPRTGTVRAPYKQDEGRVIGRMMQPKCFGCGVVLTGVWVEKSSGQKCATAKDGSYYWGAVKFEFNPEYTAFSGSWDYCGTGASHAWTGRINE